MEPNLSVKVTLDLTSDLTFGELKAFVKLGEAAGHENNDKLAFDLNSNDELCAYAVYVDPDRIKLD
ncbi:hypothetical protein [Arthrobacter sp. AQ5-05]|uniref:hypothetical protein n=1 Tax=Arthrobacter sp. AQ5-05 TaxID=2184581 RepID=UPI0015EB96A7|nr:hypothetical protein [Arthrobacter sp. AQ5-05]